MPAFMCCICFLKLQFILKIIIYDDNTIKSSNYDDEGNSYDNNGIFKI